MGWLRLACVSIQLHPMETGCLHTSSNVAKIGEGLKRGFAEHIGYFCNSYVTFAIVYDAIDMDYITMAYRIKPYSIMKWYGSIYNRIATRPI